MTKKVSLSTQNDLLLLLKFLIISRKLIMQSQLIMSEARAQSNARLSYWWKVRAFLYPIVGVRVACIVALLIFNLPEIILIFLKLISSN